MASLGGDVAGDDRNDSGVINQPTALLNAIVSSKKKPHQELKMLGAPDLRGLVQRELIFGSGTLVSPGAQQFLLPFGL